VVMNNFYEFQVFMDMNDETGEYFTINRTIQLECNARREKGHVIGIF